MTVALLACAALLDRPAFSDIGVLMSVATLGRAVLHNLYERSYFPWPHSATPWLIVGTAGALLLLSLPFAFRIRRIEAESGALKFVRSRPEQIIFFSVLILITAMLATETSHSMLTVAWGVEALLTFVFALLVKERSFRVAALGLLLLCAGKILLFDFWSFAIRDKAITGIVIGLTLIAVSLLYTRKREEVHQLP